MFFPGKPRLLRDITVRKKKYFWKVWCEQESEICGKESDIHHKLPHHTAITLTPSTLNGIQVRFPPLFPRASTEQKGSSRSIYSTTSLSFLQSADTTWTHLLLSKAPWRLWTTSWINTGVFLGLLGKISLLYNSPGNSSLDLTVGFLCLTPSYLTSQNNQKILLWCDSSAILA